ncbi:MAG TPA: hypothetical protein VE263_01380 [Candidatus Angelobacter sp.]|nr:hypothetical protein [Candidatus Angelobacter sp.]
MALQFDGPSGGEHFHWNWKDWQELSADQSLRKVKLTFRQKKAIASAITEQIRPMMADLEIRSEAQLQKAALDTRVKMIDLNGDGVPEVVAQAMVNCGATGNCPFWVFRKVGRSYELILDGGAQTFTIQKSGARFADIVLSSHGSASSGGLAHYRYHDGVYERVGCYEYDWTSWEGDEVRELKEPRITPCSERNK